MPIDLSQLTPEKRAFLKANPDLLKSLEQEISRQVAGMQKREEKLWKGKAKWQRDLDAAEQRVKELTKQYDPALMQIQANLDRKALSSSVLFCPKCHDRDYGNKVNGIPWCLKCHVALTSTDTSKKRKLQIKVVGKSLRSELAKLNPGLYPAEAET